MSVLGFDDIQNRKSELVRKSLQGGLYVAPSSADAITTLTTAAAAGLNALPEGYRDVGWLTTDGAALSEGVTTTDINAWGTLDPVRSDITKRTTTVKISMQETNQTVIELYTGVALDSLTPDATTGEVSTAIPLVPAQRRYRVLVLGVDLTDNGEIYVGRFLPSAAITDLDDQTLSDGDDATLWGVTFTAYPDSVLGYAVEYLFGGPGWKAITDDMGFGES